MIKDIFLPEKIGHRRIIAQRIAGISVQEDNATLALIYAKRSGTFVESMLYQPIEPGDEEKFNQRATVAVKTLMAQVKNYDQTQIAIPASIVVFKELQLPFVDTEKIRMVLDYEIESMLPFSLDEAIIDFIITKQIKDQNSSQILVAAVRRQDLASFLEIFQSAGIEPSSITIDLFALYGLYQQISDYQSIVNGSALVDIGEYSTRIAFLVNGELRLTRYIQRGLATIAKSISEEINLPADQILQKLTSFGIKQNNEDGHDKSIQKHFINFFNDIQFTLNSFSLKLNFYEDVNKILFTGKAADIKNFVEFSNNTLQIPSELFDCQKIFENKTVKNKIKTPKINWNNFPTALGTALPSIQQEEFDLRRKDFALVRQSLLIKQLITACIIMLAIFSIIGINGYIQISNLKEAAERIETTEIGKLKKVFPKGKPLRQTKLQGVLKEAENIVKEKSAEWAPFAKLRIRPLELLQEITTIIDKKEFDVKITRMSITTDKEQGFPKIEIDGLFRSKTGENHHKYFEEGLEKRFKESPILSLTEDISTSQAEGKAIMFTAKMVPTQFKKKEK